MTAAEIHIPLAIRPLHKVEDWIHLVRIVALNFVGRGIRVEDSEEYSDGLIGLLKATRSYQSQFGLFKTYAYRCIINQIIKGKRSRARQAGPKTISIDDLENFDILETDEEEGLLEALLTAMPEATKDERRRKKILRMLVLDGLNCGQIAKKLKLSRMTVMTEKKKAVEALRQVHYA